MVRKHEETVCKARRNKKLVVQFTRKDLALPLPKGGGFRAQVHRDVEYLPRHDTDKLPLGMRLLVMEAAQHTSRGFRLVVLHEALAKTGCGKIPLAVGLEKISPAVAEDLGLDGKKPGDGQGSAFERHDEAQCYRIIWARAEALSVLSQLNPSRPKCPYEAVFW